MPDHLHFALDVEDLTEDERNSLFSDLTQYLIQKDMTDRVRLTSRFLKDEGYSKGTP